MLDFGEKEVERAVVGACCVEGKLTGVRRDGVQEPESLSSLEELAEVESLLLLLLLLLLESVRVEVWKFVDFFSGVEA